MYFISGNAFPMVVKSPWSRPNAPPASKCERELWRVALRVFARAVCAASFRLLEPYLGVCVSFSVPKMKTP